MHGNVNVKEIHVDFFFLKKMLGKYIVKVLYLCYSKTQHVLYLYAAKHTVNQHYLLCVYFGITKAFWYVNI
jgi:hypothetical protein